MSNFLKAAACVAAMAMVAACGQPQKGAATGETVRIDGSSTVFPLSEAVAEAFQNEQRRVRVSVGESGTGGGFRKFCRGETEVQDASRPILADEMEACKTAGISYVEAPIAFDGITVVVNPSNPINSITMADLRTMWAPESEGKVTNWRQINSAYPSTPLQLFGADTASGTFDFFTEAVVGKAKSSRTDYTPSADDNVTVQGVANNAGAVGYFGIAYYEQNKDRVKALSIDGGAGPIAPSAETVSNATYPLRRPMFIYVNADALRRPAVQQFVQFYVSHAAEYARQVGYIPLPENAAASYGQRFRERTVGTAFGGRQDVGATIEEVLARPLAETTPPAQ